MDNMKECVLTLDSSISGLSSIYGKLSSSNGNINISNNSGGGSSGGAGTASLFNNQSNKFEEGLIAARSASPSPPPFNPTYLNNTFTNNIPLNIPSPMSTSPITTPPSTSPASPFSPIIMNQQPMKFVQSNIHNLDWSQVVNVTKSTYKRNSNHVNTIFTVTFRKVNEPDTYFKILLKSSPSIAQEVYTSVLASICRLPLPLMRLVDFNSPEYQTLFKSLFQLAQGDSSLLSTLKKESKKKFFLIMEHTESKSLGDSSLKDFSGSCGEKKFFQLGQILAFDLFCNNMDRFNYQKQQGDSDQLLMGIMMNESISKHGWNFTVTDVCINFIVNSSFTVGYHKHINRLKSILFSLCNNPYTTESAYIKKIRESIQANCQVSIPESTGLLLQHGLVVGIQSMVDLLTPELLATTKDKVRSMVTVDYDGIWKRGIDCIYLPYLYDNIQCLKMIQKPTSKYN